VFKEKQQIQNDPKKVYTLWHEKYYCIIVNTVFIQRRYDMRDDLEFWIQLHSRPEIEISFKFILKILTSKEWIYFLGPLCILGGRSMDYSE
jgi:hypothetical protein